MPVISANLIPNEPEPVLRVTYIQSSVEGCVRRSNQTLDVAGEDIIVQVTLMQPPDTPQAIPCHEETVEVEEVLPLDTSLVQGERYRIKVNGLVTATFTPPGPDLGYTHLGESLVQDFEIEEVAGEPGHYHLGVASGRPSGSCTRFNGYEVIRREPHGIGVKITHHQVSDPNVMCTNDFPIDETLVLLGSAFEAGVEYTVTVNGQARTFSP